ncbi:MAG: ATP-binding cassette domain-containing protein [Acidobacteria bacterium]|nr:ATP-binding cassette domain-containing protein [Acidobacteriota bacterium]
MFGLGSTPSTFTTVRSAEDVDTGPLIKLDGISKVLGAGSSKTQALEGIDLEIERGEFVGVNGPSGCGKTTLLSILGLLDTPTGGSYLLNGHETTKLAAGDRAHARNREIGFIFQSFNLIGDMTVAENVDLPLSYLGLPGSERRERVAEALERFDLSDVAKRQPSQLSGGHQQRVAVARAVVGRPEILLADEPTGNLNSEQAVKVVEMLSELHAEGATICLVSHDPRWSEVTQRTLNLFDGTLVAADFV